MEGADAFRSKLKFQVQHEVFRVKVREGRIGEITEILAWYEYINDVILDHLDDEIKSTDRSGVWRYLISFKVSPGKRRKGGVSLSFRISCGPLRTLA